MPSMDAIQQAVREPLSSAPREHNAFAIYIFERAREIDHERALRRGQPIDAEFEVVFRKPPRPALNAKARRKEDMRKQFRVHRLMCQGLTRAEAEEQYETGIR